MIACSITYDRQTEEYQIVVNRVALQQIIRAMVIYDVNVTKILSSDCGPLSSQIFGEYREQNNIIATKFFGATEWEVFSCEHK